MSDMGEQQTAATTEAPEAPQTQETPAPNDPITARLDEMAQQLGQLTQHQAPAEPEWQGGLSDLAYMGNDQFAQDPGDQQFQSDQNGFQQQYSPEGYQDPQALQQQQAMDQLNEYVQQAVQQAVKPIEIERGVERLLTNYPALADNKIAGKVYQEAVQHATQLGSPELARNPKMIELVYLAQQARNSATQETPADGGNSVHLEGGGAAPTEPELDGADRMVEAWKNGPR